ncbi:solute carrier family 22 member 6-like [Amblyomma americanum]
MVAKQASFAGLGPLLDSDLGARRRSSATEGEPGVPLGEGSFQVLLLVASMVAGTTFLLHLVSFRLTTRVMDHWCRPPEAFSNLSADEWRALALPVESDGSRSRCTRREPPDADERATGGRVVPCEAWDFDLERYGNNIVSEWRLVCDRRWLVELAVLTYMAACVVCLPLAGLLADRVGRRVVMHVSLAALLGAGFATSLANSYPLFVALRIVVSTASNALWLVLFSVLYEVSTPSRRDAYCFAAMAVASVAAPVTMLALSGLRLRWEYFHLALMVPTCVLAATYATVGDDSPAWLMDNGCYREAESAALRAARLNGASLDDCRAWLSREGRRIERRVSELFFERSLLPPILAPSVRRRLVLVSYMWAATSFAFNQVNLNDLLPVRKSFAAVGIVAMVPMYFAAYACVARFGARRVNVMVALLFSGSSVILAGTIGTMRLDPISSMLIVSLRMLGNLVVVLAFVVTVQQYPVSARCTGICGGFALGRLTGSLGEILFRLAPQHRRDVAVCVVGIVMALAAVAAEYLPDTVAAEPPGVQDAVSAQTRQYTAPKADDVRRSMQQSLRPLPKGPSRMLRSIRRSASRDEGAPEQYSVRLSSISRSSIGRQ